MRCIFPSQLLSRKKRLERSAERSKREIKNDFSAEDAQSNAEVISNRLRPGREAVFCNFL